MKTKSQFIAELKSEYLTIQIGSDAIGYTELTAVEYCPGENHRGFTIKINLCQKNY